MDLTEYSTNLRAENLPSFFGGPQSAEALAHQRSERVTGKQVLKGLGRVASMLVAPLRPVRLLASHGDWFLPENGNSNDSASPAITEVWEDGTTGGNGFHLPEADYVEVVEEH